MRTSIPHPPGPQHKICSGLLTTKLHEILVTKKGGLLHWAPPCGSWVFLNRFTSKRSSANPLGSRNGYVEQQNTLVSRMVLLLLTGAAISATHFVVEQPLSLGKCLLLALSAIYAHPRFRENMSGVGGVGGKQETGN